MKTRIISAVILALSLTAPAVFEAHAQTPASDTAAVRAQIEAANDRAMGPAMGPDIGSRDFTALEKYWSPVMVVNSPANAIVSRDQVIESMHHGGLNYTSMKGTVESFTVINDVAIEMGFEDIVMADGPMAGKHIVRRSTTAWQRSGQDWVQIARQATCVGFDGAILAGGHDAPSTTYSDTPPTPETTAIRTQIEANNRTLDRAIGTRDFATLKKLWSPSMVVNSPENSILTREQVFAAMRDDKLKYSSSKATAEAFFVSRDVAVEMGHEDIVMSSGPMAGKPLTRRYTNIWQKTGDSWVQIARQATYVGFDGGAVFGHPGPALNR